jgi:hypothetical protein
VQRDRSAVGAAAVLEQVDALPPAERQPHAAACSGTLINSVEGAIRREAGASSLGFARRGVSTSLDTNGGRLSHE